MLVKFVLQWTIVIFAPTDNSFLWNVSELTTEKQTVLEKLFSSTIVLLCYRIRLQMTVNSYANTLYPEPQITRVFSKEVQTFGNLWQLKFANVGDFWYGKAYLYRIHPGKRSRSILSHFVPDICVHISFLTHLRIFWQKSLNQDLPLTIALRL